MALIIPDGFAHVVFELRLEDDSEPIVTTCGFDVQEFDGQVVADRLHELFAEHIMPSVGAEYTLTGVTAYMGPAGLPGEAASVYTSTEPDQVGGNTDASLPQNCALLVRKRTDLAGRRGRGRFYMPGVSESQVSAAGNILPVAVGNYQGSWSDFYDSLSEFVGLVPIVPVVLHRTEGAGTEPAPTPITVFQVESQIATQRTRMRK